MSIHRSVAISKVSKLVLITIIGLVVLISGTACIDFQKTPSCGGAGVCTVTIGTVYLRSGTTGSYASVATSNFTFTLTNPGTTTYISSMTIFGGNIVYPVTHWSTSVNKSESVTLDQMTTVTQNLGNGTTTAEIETLDQAVRSGNSPTMLPSFTTKTFTFFPFTDNESIQIIMGQSYSFVIGFANGQSVAWNVVSQ